MITLLKPYQLLLAALAAAILAAAINSYLLYALVLLLFVLVLAPLSRRFYIAVFFTALLTIASTVGKEVRLAVQLMGIGTLVYYFFKDYGFNLTKYKSLPGVLVYYFIFLFSVMIFTSVISDHPSAGLVVTAQTGFFFFIAYIIYSLIYEPRDEKMFIKVLVISGFILTITVFVDFLLSGNALINFIAETSTRASGLVSNVNASGGLIANLIPLVLAFLFYSKLGRLNKYFLFAVLLILIAGSVITGSRSAFVSLAVSISIIIFTLKRSLLKWLFLPIGLFVLLYFVYDPLNETVQLMFRVEQGLAGREAFWGLSINIIKENVWFGIGPGSYKYELFNYFPVLLDSWVGSRITKIWELTDGSNASHNFYLLFFSDMGILGLLASVLLPIVFYVICLPVLKYYKHRDDYNYLVSLSVFAIGTGLFIRSFFDQVGLLNYGYLTTDLPFWVFFAVIVHYYRNLFMADKK